MSRALGGYGRTMPLNPRPSQFGRTAADALAFLPKADTVLVSVRVGLDWPCAYLGVSAATLVPAIAAYSADHPMPCEYEPSSRTLTLGSLASIRAMTEPQRRAVEAAGVSLAAHGNSVVEIP